MRYFLLVIFLLVISVSRAQQGIDLDHFNHFADEMNFTFKIPDGYFPFDFKEDYSHSCRRHIMVGSPNYAIQNKNKSIAIAFRIGNWYKKDTVGASKLIRRRNPEWTVDYDYLHVAKTYADTIVHSIIKLPTEFAKTNFNGSNAIALVSFCTHRYLGMPYDKIYSVSKKGRGYVSIAFYYNEESKENIDLEIDRVLKSKMIYFND